MQEKSNAINQATTEVRPRIIGDIFAFIIGLCFTLAFSPAEVFTLGIICPAVLLVLWLSIPAKRAALRGLLFGLGFFGTGASWIYVSIHTYGYGSVTFSIIVTVLFVLYLSAFFALQGYLFNRFFPKTTISKCLLVFPSLWVLFEWLRGWLLTGFPWLFVGYSQTISPLKAIAPLASVYGVSWACTFTSGILVALLLPKTKKWYPILIAFIVLLWGGSSLLLNVHWTDKASDALKVSLVQANISQKVKWSPEQVNKTLALYRDLTLTHWDKSDLFVWPEAAITVTASHAEDYLADLAKRAQKSHKAIIAGIPIVQEDRFYNGVIGIGEAEGSYNKRHLVPFGEYMPLRSLLDGLKSHVLIPMSDFSAGERFQPEMTVLGRPIGVFVCYEIAFADEVRDVLPKAQWLLTVTDDSWFGKSWATWQHLQMAQMRALETGRYLLMSTNDGVTAIIAADGQIERQAPLYTQVVLRGHIYAMTGATPWVVCGLYPVLSILFILLIIGYLKQYRLKSSS